MFSLRADAMSYSSLRPQSILHKAWHWVIAPGKRAASLKEGGGQREQLFTGTRLQPCDWPAWRQRAGMKGAPGAATVPDV